MGERKGVNKYYPPDFDPSKGSLNTWLGSHPLRDRAKKLHKGILVIRFEMPYNIWCGGCNKHIGMGVRYNAEKSKVGNYYTTPIYKFRMKCHLCDNYFVIQTDPKNHDYVITEGARRKEQRWDPKENEQIVPEDKATQKKMATDPMFKLEHGSEDKGRGKVAQLSVAQIEDMRESWNDDYMLNKLARSRFRGQKKEIAAVKAADKALLEKSSLDIELVPETEEDHRLARLMKYSVTKSFDDKQKEKRKAIENRPLFSKPSASCTLTLRSEGPLSRRAEIKHKLGLHLSSARVEQALSASSPSPKGLVKNVGKAVRTKATTQQSGPGLEPLVSSVSKQCPESANEPPSTQDHLSPMPQTVSVTSEGSHQATAQRSTPVLESLTATNSKERSRSTDTLPSDQDSSSRVQQTMPVTSEERSLPAGSDKKDLKTAVEAEEKKETHLDVGGPDPALRGAVVEEEGEGCCGREAASIASVDPVLGSETVHCDHIAASSSVRSLSKTGNGALVDESTGLAALMASYSDSESDSSGS